MRAKKHECKRCMKTTRKPLHFCWEEYNLCPQCYDMTSLGEDETLHPINDGLVISREFNPVDIYWNTTTHYHLTHNLKI